MCCLRVGFFSSNFQFQNDFSHYAQQWANGIVFIPTIFYTSKYKYISYICIKRVDAKKYMHKINKKSISDGVSFQQN